MAAFLKACASGKIPAKAPAAKVDTFYSLTLDTNKSKYLSQKSNYLKYNPLMFNLLCYLGS